MSDTITETAKIYDDYVKHYNDAGSSISTHISILADFLRIQETLKERTNELSEVIDDLLTEITDQINAIPDKDIIGIKGNNKVKLKNDILSRIKYRVESSFKFYSLDEIALWEETIVEFFDGLENHSRKSNIDLATAFVKMMIPRLIQSQNHKAALWDLNDKIINDHYPNKLPFYDELPEDEKSRIRSNSNRLGAPLAEDVPQEEIQRIVTDLLGKHKQGQIIMTDKNGEKMMCQIIHKKGRYEGKANLNQIFKYFEKAHPHLINISVRQFKERIKKALPEDLKDRK